MLFATLLAWVVLANSSAPPPETQSHPTSAPTSASAPAFVDAARTVTDAIQKTLYDEKTGLYVQSPSKRQPALMWANGVMFSALVAAARHDAATYRPVMERFFTALDRHWDAKAAIPGYEPAPTSGDGHDKYYDDNEWMVITFLEANELTHDAKYLDRAREALAFCLSGWDDQLGGGIWWHERHKGGSKNTCSNAPAAVGCLRLARFHDSTQNVDWAQKLVRWTSERLQDQDGLFFDNRRVMDGRLDARKYTYNSALMLRANLGLYRATGEAQYLEQARRIGNACESFMGRESGAYRDGPTFSHLLVEADLELHRATGDAAALARARQNGAAAWARWEKSPPAELLDQAATARMLWLLADQESETGRAFWKKADTAKAESR